MLENEIPKTYDPREAEPRCQKLWEEKNLFHAEDVSDKPAFSMAIPPPNVTGALHLGHALFVAIQDLIVRWKRMSGYNTLWLPGTDHAGIATQMVVERELQKTEKKSRHDLGREEFLKRVWAWKEAHGNRIVEQLQALGASCDWSRLAFTMDEQRSRAVREAFVQLHEQGLIYRANRLINWCPRCRTALSDLEVEHEDREGSLWHIAYPVVGGEAEGLRLIVATTRPETMLGDTAVAVHPEDPRYRDLIGRRVRLPLTGREIPIIGDAELVSMEFGTGAVKVTPAHDFNDNATGQRHGLESISIFDANAITNANAGRFQGLDRSEARKQVVAALEAEGLLIKTEPHALSLGLCQRCNDVVEPMLSPQWFVKIAPLAEPALRAVEEGRTRFVPESWTNTWFAWMRNLHDWCISRQLWWGHQIPAWYCGCGEVVVRREDPTRCPKCEGPLTRDPDVLDTWFSSGLWPFSTLGWPDKTAALSTFYPTDVMETGHDIIFFWVARMMMFGLHFMGEVPFTTVFLHAMVRDEKGEKMSKVKGNVIDPLDVIHGQPDAAKLAPDLRKKFPKGMAAYGADALRITLVSLTAQGRDIKLSMERVEGYRNFANKIWNASRFLMMNLGDPAEVARSLDEEARGARALELSLADRWIRSRLARAVGEVTEALAAYKFNEASNAIFQFFWREFCDRYIELSKGALYGEDEARRQAARAVLLDGLGQALRLLHPFMPYLTEELWQRLPRRVGEAESIMVSAWPKATSEMLDQAAEEEMELVLDAIDAIRNVRGESDISPAKKVPVHIHATAEVLAALEKNRAYLSLAGLETLSLAESGERPKLAAVFVHPRMEIFVPLAGLIDVGEEQKRLARELAKVDVDLGQLQNKLANPNFALRAPAEVVEKDRGRVRELEEKREKLTKQAAMLAEVGAAEAEGAEEKNEENARGGGAFRGEVVHNAGNRSTNERGSREAAVETGGQIAKSRGVESSNEVSAAKEGRKRGGAATTSGVGAERATSTRTKRTKVTGVKRSKQSNKKASRVVPKKGKNEMAVKKAAKKPVKKVAAKKPVKKVVAKKVAAKKPVKKVVAKKPVKKVAAKKPVKKVVAKKVAAKKPVKKVAAKKVAAKKPAKKAVAKKVAAKKVEAPAATNMNETSGGIL